MFVLDVLNEFDKRVRIKISEQQALCGKGIHDRDEYWRRVGEIGGLKLADALLHDIVKHHSDDEDDE